ncbi:MAG: amidase [Candidatus Lambdaproteobacteria bacterium]|nr:amidase [Candidatus Lambdaproteobacteria bacterium]
MSTEHGSGNPASGGTTGAGSGSGTGAATTGASGEQLCAMTACELSRRLRGRELSAREVMEAHLERIAQVNPKVNAIVTLVAEQALAQARDADARAAKHGAGKGGDLAPLHGMPIGIKDLHQTKGIRTTYGSPIFKDNVPEVDQLSVARLKAAGGIVVGKTNTPEFGAGSQTFNPVFGATLNPYDLSRTCGGSSGGAAVALATCMLPLCDGGDTGGSLRNPANFNNVVGFRTSPGRVPRWPAQWGWWGISVTGPLGRTVGDVALMLSVMAGPDARAPISIPEPGSRFLAPLGRSFKGVRIAYTPDFGRYPVDPAVTRVIEGKLKHFEDIGCAVERAHPDMRDADEVFQVLRAWRFSLEHGEKLKTHRHLLKDTVIWNTEEGLKLTGLQVAQAEAKRTALYHRVREFLETYEYLILPVSPVPPFPVTQPYISEIDGVKLKTYIDWMALCYAITITGLPAISVPCGFTPEGLPVGVQIVGRHLAEFEVLQLAHAFEQANPVGGIRPRLT